MEAVVTEVGGAPANLKPMHYRDFLGCRRNVPTFTDFPPTIPLPTANQSPPCTRRRDANRRLQRTRKSPLEAG